jgi:Mn2+/Fe2+ NRAMP family transporter
MTKKFSSVILAAAFLMATSAVGPGFLTQTAVFTRQLAASFGFVILVSILLDIGAQLNIWTVLAVKGKKAQEVANDLMPGLGHMLSLLVFIGGLAFNIGNIAGCGLGLQVLTGIKAENGAAISAGIAMVIFLAGNTVRVMDIFTKALGVLMIALTLYVCFTAEPPLVTAAFRTFFPETIDAKAIITLVGGTVGGYISFAGVHRLLEEGIHGKEALPQVRRSAVSGILIASVMRVLLFLAALGVISQGLDLQDNNPAASVFKLAAGPIGYKLFGIVMWSAAITSVIGSSYTSFSFISSIHPGVPNLRKWIIPVFILVSAVVFVMIGQPVKILVFVGMLNGFILPIALTVILIAAWRSRSEGYVHPLWLTIFGLLVILATLYLSIIAILHL